MQLERRGENRTPSTSTTPCIHIYLRLAKEKAAILGSWAVVDYDHAVSLFCRGELARGFVGTAALSGGELLGRHLFISLSSMILC